MSVARYAAAVLAATAVTVPAVIGTAPAAHAAPATAHAKVTPWTKTIASSTNRTANKRNILSLTVTQDLTGRRVATSTLTGKDNVRSHVVRLHCGASGGTLKPVASGKKRVHKIVIPAGKTCIITSDATVRTNANLWAQGTRTYVLLARR